MYLNERGAPSAKETGAPPQTETGGACAAFGRTEFPIAMVYAPIQPFGDLYDEETGLRSGTIFRQLDLPFRGRSIMKGGTP